LRFEKLKLPKVKIVGQVSLDKQIPRYHTNLKKTKRDLAYPEYQPNFAAIERRLGAIRFGTVNSMRDIRKVID